MTDNPKFNDAWSPFDGSPDPRSRVAPARSGPTAARSASVASSAVTQDTEGK
jgi:hypothetical protein